MILFLQAVLEEGDSDTLLAELADRKMKRVVMQSQCSVLCASLCHVKVPDLVLLLFPGSENDCISNPDSTADGNDLLMSAEFDDDAVEESEGKQVRPNVMPPPSSRAPQVKIEVSRHENSDVVEDSINLTLEDEENFEEVRCDCF